ncbi:MAG: indole-3-glycerol phosphate synthase TrpC [Lachnospiraceae bacterium]|nr:indole-3-glycerol phosphate synthase TrpC [bacterium]MDY5516692.1 indole-3-glycerol phosphate synthase TrpC [Lachnospiraceae bacterium]
MILDDIVADKKIRLKEQKKRMDLVAVRRLAEEQESSGRGFYENLKKPGISIIGEFKKASPSLGNITSKISLVERIADYSASVDAISCLTEEDHFHGCVDDFKEIRRQTELPMIRKDFMIDEYQFYEAKAIGADAILLIAAILDDAQMKDFYALTCELGMDALVETHDEAEMERALALDAKIIGVNNRNLKDFTISLDNTMRLRPMVPKEKCFVAESGIITDDDIRLLKEQQVDAFLIGRALMEAEDPGKLANHWKSL